MTRREQKRPNRLRETVELWWISLFLLTMTVCLAPPASQLTAQTAPATDETQGTATSEESSAKQQATQEESDQAEKEPDSAADPDKEAPEKQADEPAEKQEQPTENSPEQSKSTPDAKQPSEESKKEAETADREDSAPQADSKEMKAPANAPTVEEERPIEVEPPNGKAENKSKTTESPKKPQPPEKKKCIIGATATLLEKQSELKFRARVDSGAKSCSLHVEEIRIEDESTKENEAERMSENVGKVIHFQVKNGDKKTHILSSKIAGYVIIKTSNKNEGKRRYKVPLTFLWKNVEKEVLVTLNDRGHMEYPLLLGRNFLRGDFLVDVELDSDD